MKATKFFPVIFAFFLLAYGSLFGQSYPISQTYEEAYTHYRSQDYAKSLKILKRAIRRTDNNRAVSELYNLRACVYYDLNLYGKALEDLNKAIQLGTAHPSYLPYCNRGRIRLELGDEEGASTDFILALLIDAENTILYLEDYMPGFIEEISRVMNQERRGS